MRGLGMRIQRMSSPYPLHTLDYIIDMQPSMLKALAIMIMHLFRTQHVIGERKAKMYDYFKGASNI